MLYNMFYNQIEYRILYPDLEILVYRDIEYLKNTLKSIDAYFKIGLHLVTLCCQF